MNLTSPQPKQWNPPIALLECKKEKGLPIEKMNHCFTALTGYDYSQTEVRFHNQLIAMASVKDRQKLQTEVDRQLQRGDGLCFTFWLECQDGSYKLVVFNGQVVSDQSSDEQIVGTLTEAPVYQSFVDSTAMTEICPAAWDELEHCVRMPGITIIECDLLSDTLLFAKNQSSGRQYLCTNISAYAESFQGIHTDDIPRVRALLDDIRHGWLYTSAEFRLLYEESGYSWFRINFITLRDRNKLFTRVIGQIANINQEISDIDILRSRAEMDALTGVYNREQTETQIKYYLNRTPGEMCAFIVIDIDNFKQINDTQGHMLGDVVLSEMASAMKRVMRASDVVGRIGGDEFVIFMKDAKSAKNVEAKAENLQKEFRSLFRNEKLSLQITCSIGIALYPDNGTEYKVLFNHADQALYQAKVLGKDRFSFFSSVNRSSFPESKQPYSGTEIDSDSKKENRKNDLLTDIFKFLYRTEDTDTAINMILEIIGKRFDVSRAYVFENTEDGRFSSNTYEWCNTGIQPEIDNLQNVEYEPLGNYVDLYDENSLFYCRDISKLKPEQKKLFESQNIHSTLQCAFWRDKRFAGFIGFDECTGLRLWTQEEVDILSLISQMMTTFIQRRRVLEWNRLMEKQIHTILDLQDTCLYVIDQNTYEILYLGPKTKSLNAGIQLGDYCYEALFKKSGPCDFCPLFNGGTCEADIPGSDIHINMSASAMKWLGNDAYLLSYSMEKKAAILNSKAVEEDFEAERDIINCIHWFSSADYMADTVEYVLGVIKNYYKADRVYIVELNIDEEVANNTYEVCAEGVNAQIDVLQGVPFEEITFWVSQFKTRGYIKIDDIEELGEERRGEYEILKPQGITSLMAIPVYLKGKMAGFLGIDNPKVHKKNFHYLKSISYFLENEMARNIV